MTRQCVSRRTQMHRFSLKSFASRWWPRRKTKSQDDRQSQQVEGDRRQVLHALSVFASGGALAAMPQTAQAQDSSSMPPPKRALTGRDGAGKSVFKSFDVTPMVVSIDSSP